MRPDDDAVDHVGRALSTRHLGQSLEQGIEYADLNPAPIAAEDAIPLAIFVRQVSPLRAGPRHPHYAFEEQAVVTGRTAASPSLRRQQQPDQRPLLVGKSDPLAQHRRTPRTPPARAALFGAEEGLKS